jgi:hypothetical protein
MLFSFSILIAWLVSRLGGSRRAAALPESRTPGSGNPHAAAPSSGHSPH